MALPIGKLISASFFWKNDQPGGLGFTLGPPSFQPTELNAMFSDDIVAKYMRDSDEALGSGVVNDYLAQLAAIAAKPEPSLHDAILAALNILWLAERGFIPNNEFNGPHFVLAEE